jgi:hypothetical protein
MRHSGVFLYEGDPLCVLLSLRFMGYTLLPSLQGFLLGRVSRFTLPVFLSCFASKISHRVE